MEKRKIDGVELYLAHPLTLFQEWIGQTEALEQLLACWLTLSETDQPLTPRIIGVPGLGKTTLAIAAAKKREQEIYIMQCTADTRPEDLLVTPVLGQNAKIKYHASPLVSAMLKGGVVILDEGNRMSEKSWASLASLLDDRRMVESIIAGITIPATSDFRCVVTMNDDSSTYEIPDYIMSRLQPAIELDFPDKEDELQILQYNLPECPDELLDICIGYLQQAHDLDLPFSIRDGLNIIRYSQRLRTITKSDWVANFNQAVTQILGEEALDLDKLARQKEAEGDSFQRMQMGNFFFEEDDPLNPDNMR
ncbi:MAG: AAA family ATPase [Fibrobacteria bacterium]|nr:AAA family ATPase [Fibrobacteria bacterium]